MYAGLLDVLHDAADQDRLTIAHRIYIDFDRHIQEAIQQHRTVIGYAYGLSHVSAQILFAEHNLHLVAHSIPVSAHCAAMAVTTVAPPQEAALAYRRERVWQGTWIATAIAGG